MDASVQQLPDATLINIKGRIDHKTAKDFEEALQPHNPFEAALRLL